MVNYLCKSKGALGFPRAFLFLESDAKGQSRMALRDQNAGMQPLAPLIFFAGTRRNIAGWMRHSTMQRRIVPFSARRLWNERRKKLWKKFQR